MRALGGQAVLVGVVGRDAAGDGCAQALARSGVDDARLVTSGGRPTTRKTRIIAHHQQLVRADREPDGDISREVEQRARRALPRGACPRARAVIVSDYAKGVCHGAADEGDASRPRARQRRAACWSTRRSRHFAASIAAPPS